MEESQPDQLGSLEAATKNAAELLEVNPVLAAEQALEILEAIPNHPPAMFLLASAKRRSGDPQAAVEILEPLLNAQQKWAAAYFEYGASLGMLGRGDEAIQSLRRTVQLNQAHPEAWRVLADHLMATGDDEGGGAAYARHIQCSTRDPLLQEAAAAMVKNEVAVAERLLKSHLAKAPTDVPAIRMLAEVAMRCGRTTDAENLLQRCLELAPGFAAARCNYALLLHRRNESPQALVHIEKCLESNPQSPNYRNLAAVILSRVGEYERASEIYSRLLDEYPGNPKVWLSYGHVLKTEGRQDDCVEAYRGSIARDPGFGEAYWSLANLKTFRFTADDLSAMDEQLANPELSDENRWHFHFALGKAAEDAKDYAASFKHYSRGNALQHATNDYDAERNATRAKRLKGYFTCEFFAEREGMGCDSPDPVFILGMPRSGSTLLEQILSCHSQVEGTIELPDMTNIARELRDQAAGNEAAAYVEVVAGKSAEEIRALGEQFLENTRIHRKTGRPFFIDKMPNNFLHIGLIHLILPNAKIIDARRHPMGCCFSNFKQYYARGQKFSYSLQDMGRFYYDYVDLMKHFDEVLPGRVHRVFYEDTVADTETVVRKLLDYCGLEFEPECLRFFESKRPVRTASSEQVRQPIYKEGVEQWRHYEEWLDPLKAALGDVLDAYPGTPKF
jgi:tetratricopeptide (TPR) repeat protein